MREVIPNLLWIGHAQDGRNIAGVLDAGVRAVIDLAHNEPPVQYPRDIIYCRFPLDDGAGNEATILRAAIAIVKQMVEGKAPTLVFCSAGMSRSPAIVAAAIAEIENKDPDSTLQKIADNVPADVSPALWNAVKKVISR